MSTSAFATPQAHASPSSDAYVAVPSSAAAQAARAASVAEAAAWGEAGALPDPAMVWGSDSQGSLQNYVVASALYHANEELRRKLNESSTTLQTLQQELASTRGQHAAAQTRLENVTAQLHQLVRERDLATQKHTNAAHSITELERTLRDRIAEEEKVRFSLESQIAELRSRLVVGADSNDLLQKDVRSLLAETRDRTAEAMKLRSNLALTESALSSQRNVNENMLVELRSLNNQLIEERKRLLSATRESQLAALSQARVADLEQQLQRAREERNAIEREHVGLMSEFVHVTEDALRHAHAEVRSDVANWKAAAAHWEQVSQLLYKDIAERTQQHLQCRAECEEAQGQRDTNALQVRALKEEVALLSARLDVVWPSHASDAKGLTAEEILAAFGRKDRAGVFLFDERRRRRAAALARRRRPRNAAGQEACAGDGDATEGAGSAAPAREGDAQDDAEDDLESSLEGKAEEDLGFDLAAAVLGDLPADPTTVACQIQELHEANATLLSEVHRLRLTNDLLQDRLSGVTGREKAERARVAAAEVSLQAREQAGHKVLERQLDRVAFLEAQVRSLRGYHVPANAPIEQVADNENIFELFLGQLVAAEVPAGVEVPGAFSTIFCSADLLVHETITTGAVRGFNGFFDVTASFCVSMDALLFYYLHTRHLLVQLHRVRDADEAAAAASVAAKPDSAAAEGREGSGTAVALAATADAGERASSRSSTHPSLRMAEHMYETIAEGEVSLADIVLREDCRHAERPTLKGHVRLCTPGGRHIASLEFRLTARRPYTETFMQLVEDAAARAAAEGGADPHNIATTTTAVDLTGGGGREDSRHETSSHVLEWMRTTADTSHDAGGAGAGRRESDSRGRRASALRETATRQTPADGSGSPLRGHTLSRASQMQLVPVTGQGPDAADTSSTASSFFVPHQRSPLEGPVRGALVAHLPAPSPPPPHRHPSPSPWSRAHAAPGDGPEPSADARGHAMRSPLSGAFAHVDRSLLSAAPSERGWGGGGSGAAAAAASGAAASSGPSAASIECLWVDVERLELPADLPSPIPRLSCYFHVPAVGKEVWLEAPPTPRYTWAYTLDVRDSRAGAYGVALPIRHVTQLANALREPLVVFLLDADVLASTSATADVRSGGSCVWGMVVCEWAQAVQHPNEPQSFTLPLLRSDQTVVRGAVLRLTLTASTLGVDTPQDLAAHLVPPSHGALVPPPPLTTPPAPPQERSIEEELLRLEYDHHTGRGRT